MASKRPEVNSIIVPFAKVMWNKAFNRARPTGNYGDANQRKALVGQLAREAWWKGPNGLVEADTLSSTWKVDGNPLPLSTLVEQEMERRNEQWKFLKMQAENDTSKANDLKIFEEIYVHNGKLIRPEYLGVTGNRRGSAFLEAMIVRSTLKADDGNTPLPRDYDIPLRIDDFSDQERRLDEQVKENVGKTQANLATSSLDMLLIAREMLSLGSTQGKLRTRFGDSQGVKMYYMCIMDRKYPDLKIINRCQLPADDPTWIPLQSVKYPVLQDMAQRFDAASTDEHNKKLAKKNEGPKPVLTREEVADYFADVRKNPDGGSIKMLDKNAVLSISQVHANPFVQLAAKRVYTNAEDDANKLKKAEVFGPACENLIILEGQGDLPFAEKILDGLVKLGKGKVRDNAEAAILEILESRSHKAQPAKATEKRETVKA